MISLVEAIKRVDQKKANNTQKRTSHNILSGILTLKLSCKQRCNEETSKPQQESALDHKWFSIHMGEEWISNIDIGLHQAYNWTSHWRNKLESM